jgi:hypothetical protein
LKTLSKNLAVLKSTILTAAFSEIQRLEQQGERARVHEKMLADITDVEQKAYGLLLPFQRHRLDQIVRQVKSRATAPTSGLTHAETVRALGLSEADLQAIKRKASEAEVRLNERVEMIRKELKRAQEEARAEVLSVLTDEQRRLYRDYYGQIFDLNADAIPTKPRDP